MIKEIKVRSCGYMRTITKRQMYCDCCGQPINWALPHPKGQFCDKCYLLIKENKADIISQNGCGK